MQTDDSVWSNNREIFQMPIAPTLDTYLIAAAIDVIMPLSQASTVFPIRAMMAWLCPSPSKFSFPSHT
jgi:hypothetical protein